MTVRPSTLLPFVSLLFVFAYAGPRAQQPLAGSSAADRQNVVMVAIDGIRMSEAFEARDRYLKHLWTDLKPQGTLFTNVWNLGPTYTSVGHAQNLTGAWQFLPNNGRLRPLQPTLMEYYLRLTGEDPTTCWVISGKGNSWHMDYSAFPGFGRHYGGMLEGAGLDIQDQDVFDKSVAVMKRDRPRFMYIVLANVDDAAHEAVAQDYSKAFELYTEAIRHADALVFRLWNEIQSDSHYRDRTTLFVTTDHGRYADGYKHGIGEHGGTDEGSQHMFLFAVGPGIRKGTVIAERVEQIDIAPSAARLLGVSMPAAQGRVLEQLFSPSALAAHKEDNNQRPAGNRDTETEAARWRSRYERPLLPLVADAAIRDAAPTTFAWDMGDALLLRGLIAAGRALDRREYADFATRWADHYLAAGTPRRGVRSVYPAMVWLDLYEHTRDTKYLTAATRLVDEFLAAPPDGRSQSGLLYYAPPGDVWKGWYAKTTLFGGPYTDRLIIGIETPFSVSPLLARLATLTRREAYASEAVRQLLLHAEALAAGNGLFRNTALDAAPEKADRYWFESVDNIDPVLWARGNMYLLLALTETLRYLPPGTDGAPRLQPILRKLWEALINRQGQDGMWSDDLSGQVSNPETTAVGLAIYGFLEGQALSGNVLAQTEAGGAVTNATMHLVRAWQALRMYVSPDGAVVNAGGEIVPGVRKYRGFPPPVFAHSRQAYPWSNGAFLLAGAKLKDYLQRYRDRFPSSVLPAI